MSKTTRIIATGFYLGYAPVAPGTVGSLLGLFLYWAVPKSESVFSLVIYALLFFIGVWSATEVEKEAGKDASIIIIDEIVGMLITLTWFDKNVKALVIGFIIFRFFDITKPFPAKHAERLPGGWGVMMDDVIAGVYSAAVLRLIFLFVP